LLTRQIESFFSAVKRRLGEEVRSRPRYLQRKEAVMKVLVYSMLRQGSPLPLIEVLYRELIKQYAYKYITSQHC